MRNTRIKRTSALKRFGNITFGFGVFVAAYATQTTTFSNQDIAELVGEQPKVRWLMHIEERAGQSLVTASASLFTKSNVDPMPTGGVGQKLKVSERIKAQADPQRINSAIKGSRVVQTLKQKPPKEFSAGSVLKRHSLLDNFNPSKKQLLAFVKPKTFAESLKVAAVFHTNKPKKIKLPTKHLPVQVATLVKASESNVLSYAPKVEPIKNPFKAVIAEPKKETMRPKLHEKDHAWAADPLPLSSFSKKQQRCLANGIYFEARGEPARGQAAVSQVILNRVKNPAYPNSICGVVYQNKHWRNRCQFSFACDRIKDRINNKKLYSMAKHIAAETTAGRIWLSQVGSSTHYHATYVKPKWARKMTRVGKIGLHLFYRTKNGGW